MSGFRAYFDFSSPLPNIGDIVELNADESRHLCGSLRAVAGDKVGLFDLSQAFDSVIVRADKKCTSLKILSSLDIKNPDTRVVLAQCLPKGKVFDDILRQSVEIGISGIIPIVSQHCQVRFSDLHDAEKKADKWKSHIIEAVKQSANFFAFNIQAPISFADFLKTLPNFDLKIVASLEADSRPIIEYLEPKAKSVLVLVGPEGDMTASEYAVARNAGFLPAKLGDTVMKCDTAALFALSVVKARYAAL